MDTSQSVTKRKIKFSVMPFRTSQSGDANKRDDDGSVKDIFYEFEEGDDDHRLDCNDDDTGLAVACDDIPSSESCAGNDNEIVDIVRHDKTDGSTNFSAPAGDNHEPCRQVITSTDQDDFLAGSLVGMSITIRIVYSEEDKNSTEDSGGPGKTQQEERV